MDNKDFQDVHQADAAAGLSRRSFLQLGTSASLVLSGLTLGAGLVGCAPAPAAASGFSCLREADLELLRALIPAVVGAHLSSDPQQRAAGVLGVMQRIDATVSRSSPRGQKGLQDLFNLLNMSLTRRLTTGINKPWAETTNAEVEAFLARWCASETSMFNGAYRGLTRLIAVSFYGRPQSWPSVGYAGPLAAVYQAANS